MTKRNTVQNLIGQTSSVLPQEVYNFGPSNRNIIAFLSDIIPRYCKDQSLVQVARKEARYLAATFPNTFDSPGRILHDELEDVAMILEDFLDVLSSASSDFGSLSVVQQVPPGIIADVHTHIGLIRYKQECYSGAIDSLLKALWIRKSLPEEPDRLVVLCHRLGVAFTAIGELNEGKALLKRALEYHKKSHFARDVFFISDTKRLLADLELPKVCL